MRVGLDSIRFARLIFRGDFGHVETRYIASLEGFWFIEFSDPNRIGIGFGYWVIVRFRFNNSGLLTKYFINQGYFCSV